jgi:hypothetical protein
MFTKLRNENFRVIDFLLIFVSINDKELRLQ